MTFPWGKLRLQAGLIALALLAVSLVMAPSAQAARPRCVDFRATIVGTAGPDRIVGTAGDDVISAGGGDDVILASGGNDRICAGPGDDLVRGGGNSDFVLGSRGDDRIRGAWAHDFLWGQRGNDVLAGQRGNDDLLSSVGDDVLRGGDGNDSLKPGMKTETSPDIMNGGPGSRDAVYYDDNSLMRIDLQRGVVQGQGRDSIARGSVEDVWVSADRSVVIGDEQDNRIGAYCPAMHHVMRGGGGDDWLASPNSSDVVRGGSGLDTYVIGYVCSSRWPHAQTGWVDLRSDRGATEAGGQDWIPGIENVTSFDPSPINVYGDRGPNRLVGGGGNDRLNGRRGQDFVDGGDGVDTCENAEETSGCP